MRPWDLEALGRVAANLERKKRRIEDALEKINQFRAFLEGLPPETVANLESLACEEPAPEEQGEEEREKTHFEKIAEFLRGEWGPQTIADIEKGTGIPRASISAVLYRTHPDEFVSVDLSTGRAKGWQLKSEVSSEGQPEDPVEEKLPF